MGYPFLRVGKHKAGRLLDGKEWSQFPDEPSFTASSPVAPAAGAEME